MKNSVAFVVFVLFGFSMFFNGCNKIVDFHPNLGMSSCYNLGAYVGTVFRTLAGLGLIKFAIRKFY